MSRVLLVQAVAKQYRVPFFDGLHAALARRGVELQVAYGDSPPGERKKSDDAAVDPRYGVHVPGQWLFGDRLVYQPVLGLARGTDLVIVEHAHKQLVNFPLYLRTRLGRCRLALWGQGRDVLCDGRSLGERLKRRTARLADWWFAYTAGAAAHVTGQGVRPEIVTVVQNAIDTRAFRAQLAAVSEDEIAAVRSRLGMADGDPVGLFCGSLYAGKKIDFLIDAASRVRAQVPGFHLVIVGAGPAGEELAARAAGAGWVHFVGRQDGAARAVYFRMARMFLIPAFVGLAVVDAFAAGLPVLTTDLPHAHGVELEYIEQGQNGLVVAHTPNAYAASIVEILRAPDLAARLAAGARRSGDVYTIETMVANFTGGVLRCLAGGAR